MYKSGDNIACSNYQRIPLLTTTYKSFIQHSSLHTLFRIMSADFDNNSITDQMLCIQSNNGESGSTAIY